MEVSPIHLLDDIITGLMFIIACLALAYLGLSSLD